MNKIEVKEILEYVSMNYTNFQVNNDLFNMWLDELQQYDKNDVMDKLKEMLSKDLYQMKPPTLMAIVKDLSKIQEKIDWHKGVVFCGRCGKAFQVSNVKAPNALDELHKHEDKCRSIDYIIRQAKTYKGIELTRKDLWQYDDAKFEELYKRTLELTRDNTLEKDEKNRIERILNNE